MCAESGQRVKRQPLHHPLDFGFSGPSTRVLQGTGVGAKPATAVGNALPEPNAQGAQGTQQGDGTDDTVGADGDLPALQVGRDLPAAPFDSIAAAFLPGGEKRRAKSKGTAASGWDTMMEGVFRPAHAKDVPKAGPRKANNNFVKMNMKSYNGGHRRGAKQKYSDRFKKRNHKNYLGKGTGRNASHACYTCGSKDHFANVCPSTHEPSLDEPDDKADDTTTENPDAPSFADESNRFGVLDRVEQDAAFDAACDQATNEAEDEEADYERERAKRIADNHAMLVSLGLAKPKPADKDKGKDELESGESGAATDASYLQELTVAQLRMQLRRKGLKLSGKKEELVARLLEAESAKNTCDSSGDSDDSEHDNVDASDNDGAVQQPKKAAGKNARETKQRGCSRAKNRSTTALKSVAKPGGGKAAGAGAESGEADVFNFEEDFDADALNQIDQMCDTAYSKPEGSPGAYGDVPAEFESIPEHAWSEKFLVKCLKELFKHEGFRTKQLEIVQRVLTKQSTLVILPTGSGKSLCYQLPVYVHNKFVPSLVLVISPLISLMDDQLSQLPKPLKGGCLHSGMTKTQKDLVRTKIQQNKIQVLFVSPETIGNPFFVDFIMGEKVPPLQFVCVDEAHCMSEWSHNFRPSYLRLCELLRSKLGVESVLGLTATVSESACMGALLQHSAFCLVSSFDRQPIKLCQKRPGWP